MNIDELNRMTKHEFDSWFYSKGDKLRLLGLSSDKVEIEPENECTRCFIHKDRDIYKYEVELHSLARVEKSIIHCQSTIINNRVIRNDIEVGIINMDIVEFKGAPYDSIRLNVADVAFVRICGGSGSYMHNNDVNIAYNGRTSVAKMYRLSDLSVILYGHIMTSDDSIQIDAKEDKKGELLGLLKSRDTFNVLDDTDIKECKYIVTINRNFMTLSLVDNEGVVMQEVSDIPMFMHIFRSKWLMGIFRKHVKNVMKKKGNA